MNTSTASPPQPGSVVRTPDGEGTVLEVNVVSGMLKVRSNVEAWPPRATTAASAPICAAAARPPSSRGRRNERWPGTLYLVATPIGNLDDMPARVAATFGAVDLSQPKTPA